ncbi:MAG: DUF1499 domain-containing protein [Rhodothermales bacterium]
MPPCPETPNCARESASFPVAPDTLRARARAALEAMGPGSIEVTDEGAFHAVFRVVIFLDDVHVAVAPDSAGSTLTIRSASRVGHSDLGVNARRVRRFWSILKASESK